MSEENLEQKIAKVLEKETSEVVRKRRVGHTALNVLAVLSLTFGLGYYAVKKKLLGDPPSKIRKGLLYATIAGLILYKCAPDRIQTMCDYAKNRIEYEDQRHQLKNEMKNKEAELEKKTILLDQKQKELSSNNEYLKKLEYEKTILQIEKKYSDSLRIITEKKYEPKVVTRAENPTLILVKEKNYLVPDKMVAETKIVEAKSQPKQAYEKHQEIKVQKVQNETKSRIKQGKKESAEIIQGNNLSLVPPSAKTRIIEGTDQRIIDFYGRNYYVLEQSWIDVYGDSIRVTSMQFR